VRLHRQPQTLDQPASPITPPTVLDKALEKRGRLCRGVEGCPECLCLVEDLGVLKAVVELAEEFVEEVAVGGGSPKMDGIAGTVWASQTTIRPRRRNTV
jgi:hypothetical protein